MFAAPPDNCGTSFRTFFGYSVDIPFFLGCPTVCPLQCSTRRHVAGQASWTFRIFFFFAGRGRGRGESEAPGGAGVGFFIRKGVGFLQKGEGPGGCPRRIGEFWGLGGKRIFFVWGRNVHQAGDPRTCVQLSRCSLRVERPTGGNAGREISGTVLKFLLGLSHVSFFSDLFLAVPVFAIIQQDQAANSGKVWGHQGYPSPRNLCSQL